MSAQDRSMILSKIHSLVQELPTLVEGGKSINCTTHLQLVQGYIHALGTCGGSTSSSTTSSGIGKTMTASSFPYQPLIRKCHAVDSVRTWHTIQEYSHHEATFAHSTRVDGFGFDRQFQIHPSRVGS
jgi:hypothetical protein